MINIQAIPAFEDNYIWLIRQNDNARGVLVDPGEAAPVFAALEKLTVEPAAILITHHHGDHTGGVRELTARYPIPVYGPGNENIRTVTDPVHEGQQIHLQQADLRFQVLEVPGHTRGHVAYYGHGALFCGDTLFTCGCGRLFEGSPGQMFASLEKIAALPAQTLVYCAHEYTRDNIRFARVAEPDNAELRQREADTRARRQRGEATVPAPLSLELATNPFLRCRQATLIGAAEDYAGRSLAEPAEVFAVVRAWKDDLD